METIFLIVMAALMMTAAAYAQYRVSTYTDDGPKLLFTRVILLATGLVFGLLWAANYPNDPFLAALAFMIGLGAVHVPAAAILFIKRARGAGKS